MAADAASLPRFPVPDPTHPGWERLRSAVDAATAAVRLAAEEMRDGPPGDDRRVEMARLCAQVLETLSNRVGTIVLDESIVAEREARAYEAGLAAGAAGRRCTRRNPGHLRDVSDG